MRTLSGKTRTLTLATGLAALTLTVSACGGGGGFENETEEGGGLTSAEGKAKLRMLIASSGDPETNAVKAAVDEWSKETGNTVEVTPASDIQTELAKTFASANPYDVMYIDAGRFATFAEQGALLPYGADFPEVDDFYESLRATFTYEDELYCVPKDFSTLALVINERMWKEAGLTDDDIPTTWDELHSVAKKLSDKGQPGLVTGPTRDRVGAFMVQAGGWLVNEDATEATVDSEANVEALEFVQSMLKDDSAVYFNEVDAGWGGEAFGLEKAAMTTEGNWMKGVIEADFPKVRFRAVEMPEGPAGKGTLLFTQCWGVAAKSSQQEQAVDLIEALTTPEQQMTFADEFGVMPSRESVRADYEAKYPEDAAFVAGAEYGKGPVSLPGFEQVLADFDSQLLGLEKGDPQAILEAVQKNASAELN